MIASASQDATLRRWGARTGKQLGIPATSHNTSVWGVVFSPDGKIIASASREGSVRLWDAGTGQQLAPPLTSSGGWLNGAAFSPDGKMVAAAGNDGTVRLWPITIDAWIRYACILAKRNMRQDEWNEFVGPDRPYVRACPDLPSGYGALPDAPAATYQPPLTGSNT